MQVCPNCAHRNRPGVIFCESCGTSLAGESPMSTKTLAGTQNLGENDAVQSLVNALGTDIFQHGTVLRIEIDGAEPILIKPKQETVFGRRDPATGSMPDVDLTPFAGYRMGVSRKHAVIRQSEDGEHLDLFDLGSSNGTFLNGTRLSANKPHKVRDGDEVRFGQMIMRLHFQKAIEEVSATSSAEPTPSGANNTPANNAPSSAPISTPIDDKTNVVPEVPASQPVPAQVGTPASNPPVTTGTPDAASAGTTTNPATPSAPNPASTGSSSPSTTAPNTTDAANISPANSSNPTPKS